jgi:hypothetical protein
MYGFDRIRDKPLMVGSELLQVCIGGNEVILNFYPDGQSVMVYGVEKFVGDNMFLFEALTSSYPRIRQIGKSVSRFRVESNDVAYLVMSDGSEILLRDDSEEFESMTFTHEGLTIAV